MHCKKICQNHVKIWNISIFSTKTYFELGVLQFCTKNLHYEIMIWNFYVHLTHTTNSPKIC